MYLYGLFFSYNTSVMKHTPQDMGGDEKDGRVILEIIVSGILVRLKLRPPKKHT